ncbi:MAG TPA: SusC/RagA family TonB-linked outer membrane protein [Chitinophagaceae bacterium]
MKTRFFNMKTIKNKVISGCMILLLLGCVPVMAQQQSAVVTGTVVNEKSEVLSDVTVMIKAELTDESYSALTDKNGAFIFKKLKAGENYEFTVSYIGYETTIIKKYLVKKNESNSVLVRLQPKSSSLDEVIVTTALGIKRQKRSLGYATTELEGSKLTSAMSNNWTDALSGKVAGLNLVRSNGGPSGSNSIILRGENNITGSNEALVVVDGVVINNGSGRVTGTGYKAQADADSPSDYGSGLNDINPEDIASVSVLKGPAAAALYGQRGANGAVIITTKSGSKQTKGIGVSFNSDFSVEQSYRFPKFQYEYGQGNGNAKYYSYNNSVDGASTKGTSSAWGPKFNGQLYYQYDPATQAGGITRTPWIGYPGAVEDFFELGHTFTNSLALEGGNENTQIRFSATRADNSWIMPNTGYARNTFNISANHKVNDKLRLSSNIIYTDKNSKNLPAVGYNNQTVMYWTAFMQPNAPLSWIKDYWAKGKEGILQNYPFSSNPDNPYLISYEMLNKSVRNGITGNIMVNYAFTDVLNLMLRTSLDYAYEARSQQRPFDTEKFKEGMYRTQNIFSQELTTDFLLRYNPKINRTWTTSFSFGGSTLKNRYLEDEIRADMLLFPNIYNLANAKNQLIAIPYRSNYAVNSLYALANISFKNYLYLDVTGRNDWNSVLATPSSTSNASFFYPSMSMSAIVSDMVKLPKAVSFLKLRASYAGVGSGRNVPYLTSVGYVAQSVYPGGLANPTTLANLNLKPLYTSSFEVGTNVRLFNNRLEFDVALYKSNTTNQILSAGLDRATGANSAIVNAGEVENKGIEVQVNGRPFKGTREFNWNVFATFSANKNKVLSMTDDLPELQLQSGPQGASAVIAKVGGSIGALYGIGFQRAPDGQIIYKDGYAQRTTQMIYLGNVTPTWKLSIGNEFRYKRLRLSILFDGQYGGSAFSMTHASNMTQGKIKETLPGRDDGMIGKGVIDNGNNTFRPNDVKAADISLYYESVGARENAEGNTFKTDFIKFREFNLSYDIPVNMAKRLGLQKASVGLYGRNLMIWSKWPQFDPEFGTLNNGTIDKGLESSQFPSTRTIGIKLSVGI